MLEPLVSERLLRRAERLSLKVRVASRGTPTGQHRGRGHTASLELSDHRAYAPGDDFRRVDWNAFARLDTLNVKLAEPQQSVMLHLLVDRSTSMEFGLPSKARLAQQIAACLAFLALTQLDGVRIYALDGANLEQSPRYWGKGQSADALRRVAAIRMGHATDLDAALGAFLGLHTEHGLVVVLTDLLSPTDFRPRLRQVVAAGFDVAVVHILSEQDVEPDLSGDLELVDSETGMRRRIAATPESQSAYQRGLEKWRNSIVEDCRGLGVRYVFLLANQPIESVVLSDLRRSGLLE